MSDIVTMRFQSAKQPEEKGSLILSTDGNIRMEPSDEMLEAIANLEQKAVELSGRTSKIVASTLIGLGLLAAAAGWLAGRTGGRLRHRIVSPRSVSKTKLKYVPERGIQLIVRDTMAPPVVLNWERGEYNVDEAVDFVRIYGEMKKAEPETR